MADYRLETALGAARGRRVVGLDEVGRGPWAGPVVAAAVELLPERLPPGLATQLTDSKRLSAARRQTLAPLIRAHCTVALGQASVTEIDRLNILQASLLAMTRAVAALGFAPDAALVDGNRTPQLDCTCQAVVKGDAKSLSIAAASIVAKVHRDAIMAELARIHPGYGWERNAGYGTAEHRAALTRLGASPLHRRSFRPVRESLSITD